MYAFAGCKKLTSITIPISVTNIEFRAFEGCTKIKVTINNEQLYNEIIKEPGKYGLIKENIIDGSNPTGGGNKKKKPTKKNKTKSTKKKKTKSTKKKKTKSTKKNKTKSTKKKKTKSTKKKKKKTTRNK